MRSPIKVACSSILLLLAPLCAAAFENVNISPGQSEEMQSGNANTSQDVSASLTGTRGALSGQHQPDGTAINIPGLGTVGVIPKLDFGMELLYSDENKQQAKPSPEDDDEDALQIRGTIKHRF